MQQTEKLFVTVDPEHSYGGYDREEGRLKVVTLDGVYRSSDECCTETDECLSIRCGLWRVKLALRKELQLSGYDDRYVLLSIEAIADASDDGEPIVFRQKLVERVDYESWRNVEVALTCDVVATDDGRIVDNFKMALVATE